VDERTERLIRELAAEFGATGKHLWEVMVYQAFVTGVTNVLIVVVMAVMSIGSFWYIKSKTTVPKPTYDNEDPRAAWDNEKAASAWLFWGFLTMLACIAGGGFLSEAITALSNPEYWALKKLLP